MNRTWPTRFRGWFLVYTSKGMTRGEYAFVSSYMQLEVPQ